MSRLCLKYPISQRIRFVKTLTEPACEEHPGIIFAAEGEEGEVVGYNNVEGHVVKRDAWPAPFGAVCGEEFIAIT